MNIVPVPILLVLQLLPFFLALIALYFIIFKPMLKYLDDRADSTVGAREEGIKLTEEVEKKITELNEKLKAAHSKIGEMRGQGRADATEQYNKLVHDARSVAEGEIKKAVAEIQTEQEAARSNLKSQAQSIANHIATQALGREINEGAA